MNLIEKAKSITNGIEVLFDWTGEGGIIVSQDLAQSRTDICLKCPMNKSGLLLTETVARAIKRQVELKNSLGLRTNGIKSLHTCSGCNCFLPLKIWLPLRNILPEPEERANFDDKCWLLNENPNQ